VPIGFAALLVICSGAWFVIGPALWATFESGQPFAGSTTAWTDFVNQVGSSLGPGLLLAVLGGMAVKAVIARPVASVHDRVPAADEAPVAEEVRRPEDTAVERPTNSERVNGPAADPTARDLPAGPAEPKGTAP
jgi:hypothetical protein